MSGKLPFLLFLLILGLALSACAPTPTLAPGAPSDQDNTAATIIAATVNAALASTPTVPPIGQPTAAEPTQPPAESPTPEPTAVPPTPAPPPAVRVAYTRDGNVYLWTEGVGSVGLTASRDAVAVRISPDGAMVAYKRQDPSNYFVQELWVVNTSGPTNEWVLVSAADLAALKPVDIPGMGILQFAWRPGTHEVAYSTNPLFEGPGSSSNKDLRLVNADTLAKFVLFENGQAGMFYYSPDGSQIALSNPESISLVNADGSALRANVLTFPNVITYSEYQYHPRPIWAPDSTSLRVAIPPGDPLANPLPPTGLWRIATDGSPSILLTNVQAMPFAWPNDAFAPDLAHVIYAMSVGDPAANQRELRVVNPDGTNDIRYDSGESLEIIGWAPNSQRFVYRVNGGANMGIYLGTIEAPSFQIASAPNIISEIQWVDNERFAFFIRSGDFWELRISHPGGTNHAFIDTLPDDYPVMDVLRP